MMVEPTERRPLGKTGLSVTAASYGGGSLGNFFASIDLHHAETICRAAWDSGIRYFDTAPFYGRGRSERRIGAFLERMPRDEYVLSTKVGRLLDPAPQGAQEDGIFIDPAPFDPRYDYGYDGIMRSYEDSLQRLGLARIDMLYVHDIGNWMHGDEGPAHWQSFAHGGLRALEELRSAGRIAGYGLGVNEMDACFACLDHGDPDCFLLANRFTLLDRYDALPLLDRCAELGVSCVIGGVFNSGILATGTKSGARYGYAAADEAVLEKVRRLESICAAHGVELAAAALQFPLRHAAVASVLLGTSSPRNLDRSLDCLRHSIPSSFWDDVDQAA